MVESYDVLIVGAGAVGLSAALAAGSAGLRTCLVGRVDLRNVGRTVALLDGSIRFYRSIGAWETIAPASAPLEVMRIVDDTGSLFRTPPVDFRAAEIGLPAFGSNVENARLVAALAERARAAPAITLIEDMVERYEFSATGIHAHIGARSVEARLLIAADGRKSPARKAAGIGARTWSYPQTALTALFAHTRSHEHISTEFHTRGGPFTLVPLPGVSGQPHRSSLVWMMIPREAKRRAELAAGDLALEAERQAHSILGKMELVGPIGVLPMTGLSAKALTGERIVLLGDAAHGFPPIGAQGLNLGLRDVAHLVALLSHAADPGAASVLQSYERARQTDVAMRTFGVDVLNRSLLMDFLPVDFARGLGLVALAKIGPLRRALMRGGLAPRGREPELMRAGAIKHRA